MINMFNGKLVLKQDNNLFLENNFNFKKIYVCNPEDYDLKKEYKFYTYTYKIRFKNGLELKVNFGFNKIKDVIDFEELIIINLISIKSALSIVTKGYDKFIELIKIDDIKTIEKDYDLDEKDQFAIIDYFSFKIIKELSPNEFSKLREVFYNLASKGYEEKLIAKSIWKYRDEILNDNLSKVWDSILEEVQKDKKKNIN